MSGLHDVEHGYGSCACQMVATEGGAEHTLDSLYAWRYEHGSHGESVGYAFGAGDDVGAHSGMLVCEEIAGAAVAALYLIEYEESAGGVAECAQAAQEVILNHAYAGHSLYAFDDHRGKLTCGEFLLDGFDVAQRDELHMVGGVEW